MFRVPVLNVRTVVGDHVLCRRHGVGNEERVRESVGCFWNHRGARGAYRPQRTVGLPGDVRGQEEDVAGAEMIPLLLDHGSHGTRFASLGWAHKQKVVVLPAAIVRVQDRSTIFAGDELIVLEHRDLRNSGHDGSGRSGYDGSGSGGSSGYINIAIVCARERNWGGVLYPALSS